MARRITYELKNKIGPDGFFWYVPNVGDNRKDSEPFAIEIRAPTYAEVSRLESEAIASAVAEGNLETQEAQTDAILRGQLDLIRACARGVRNYAFEDPNTGTMYEPINAAMLVENIARAGAAEAEAVISDVYSAIRNPMRAKVGALDMPARSPE